MRASNQEVVETIREVVRDERAHEHLARYFAEEGPGLYHGRLFQRVGGRGDAEKEANRITPWDLLAVQTLSVTVPPPAVMDLLEGEAGDRVSDLLAEIPRHIAAGEAGATGLLNDSAPASEAWRVIKDLHGVGYVTAGKLLARKRPRLIPIYDAVVADALKRPATAWLAFNEAMADSSIRSALNEARHRARVPSDETDLRVLDVILWQRFRPRQQASSLEESR